MCQVGEDFEGQLQRADTDRLSKKCVKCKDALPVVVIKAGDSYCRECFREYFIHKFRAMLGKNRLIFPGEKVLLAVSGGPSSCSMLSQVQEGLSQKAHKKLRFLPGIVYIDEGGAVGQSGEQRRRAAAELRAVFQASGFPFSMLPLEQVLSLPSVERADPRPQSEQPAGSYRAAVDHYLQSQAEGAGTPPPPPPQHQHQRGSPPESAPEAETQQDQHRSPLDGVSQAETRRLQQLMASAQTLTAREQLLTSLRQQLLVHTARALGYSKLMLGDSCTRLAVKLLLNISLGRGAHLAQDTGFSDSRYGDIISVRPMRDYSAKEIAYYNRLFGVPSVFIPGLDTKAKEKASIQSLTETFVTKLQEDFPSTVSTIYRTSEKLQTSCKGSSGDDACARCLLCVCALDTGAESATAFQATLLSEQLSQSRAAAATADDVTTQHPGPASAGPCGGRGGGCSSEGGQACEVGAAAAAAAAAGGGGCCSGSARAVEASAMRKLLCYSCQLTIKDMSSLDCLPDHILSEAQRRQNRSRMRAEISEFLLDQADGDH